MRGYAYFFHSAPNLVRLSKVYTWMSDVLMHKIVMVLTFFHAYVNMVEVFFSECLVFIYSIKGPPGRLQNHYHSATSLNRAY